MIITMVVSSKIDKTMSAIFPRPMLRPFPLGIHKGRRDSEDNAKCILRYLVVREILRRSLLLLPTWRWFVFVQVLVDNYTNSIKG